MRFVLVSILFLFSFNSIFAFYNTSLKPSISDTITVLSYEDSIKLLELEQITIVGEKSRSLPGAGQYITSKKIAQINQPNVNSVLRTIPGINIRDEEGFGLRPNIGLRGTPVNRSAKITLMEDGILIAPAPYADPSAYYFPTFARMQGIEVLKGSSQIKYGPYSIGGSVNLLSTQIPQSFKGFAQLSYGSFGTNQQRLWVGDSRKSLDYVFEINRLGSKGFKELDNGGNTGFDRRDIMVKVRWHTENDAQIPQFLTLKYVNSTENGNESYLGLNFDDFIVNPRRRYAATQRDVLDMNHSHFALSHTIIPAKNFSISTTAYYSNTFRDWARVNTIGGQGLNNILGDPLAHKLPYQIMTGVADGNIDFQSAARSYISQGVQSNAHYIWDSGSWSYKLNMGMRYHKDQADRFATKSTYAMSKGTMILTAPGVKGNQENQIRKASSMAAHLSYDISYKDLKLSPGVRYESIEFELQNFGTTDVERIGTLLKKATNDMTIVLPGIGFNYDINKSMAVFGGIHKGFSPPGMPSLTSEIQAEVETAVSYELGYRCYKDAWHVQIVGFENDYDNILGSDNVSGGGAGTGDLFNAGNALTRGLELSLEYDFLYGNSNENTQRLPINMAYTYTNATFLENFRNAGGDWGSGDIRSGDFIPFITPHQLTLSLGYETSKFNTMLISRYIGDTRTKPGKDIKVIPNQSTKYTDVNTIAGFLIIDLSANYKVSKSFTTFTTISNITNNQSVVANLPNGYRPNMPLSINVGIKADF